MSDRIIGRLGGPERGFLTPAVFTDAGPGGLTPAAANGCTTSGCLPAPGFCAARGYRLGSDGYNRCIVSVEQSLRRQ